MVAGRNSVLESLRARVPATALYAGPRLDSDPRVTELIRLAADARIPLIEAGRPELDRLTGGAVHQGVALKIRPYNYAHPTDLLDRAQERGEPPLVVALDGVTDPRNLGAIVRSVAAFGGHGVLVPARRSAHVSAGAWKASAGALARVPVAWAANLARALAAYQEAGLFVVGLDAQGDTPIGDLPVADGPLVLVIGSEGRGLSRLVSQRGDVLVGNPIAARTEQPSPPEPPGAVSELRAVRIVARPRANKYTAAGWRVRLGPGGRVGPHGHRVAVTGSRR